MYFVFRATTWIEFLQLKFIGKHTASKVLNAFRVFTSYFLSRITKTPIHPSFPISIAIEPTTSCNLRCPECPSGLRSFTRPTGMLDKNLFRKIIDEIASKVSWLTFYFQGEPYLNPDFLDMVSYARKKGIFTATSTNAHYLTPDNAARTVASGLNRLIISVDGSTQETYAQYRVGGDLNKVIEGTKNILEARKHAGVKHPEIIFQFLVVKPNEHQLEDIKSLAKQLGVDKVKFKSAQIYDFEKGNPLIPDNERYSRYKRNANGTYSIKNSLDNHCWRMWSSCVITWDGKVVPCCFDKDAVHVMGDLTKQSFKEIWNSKAYIAFRKGLFKSRKEIDICKNCSEGTKVWV